MATGVTGASMLEFGQVETNENVGIPLDALLQFIQFSYPFPFNQG